jgi:vacuolar-type H+-ATPase subunit H
LKEYFETLNLKEGASQEEIQAAYDKLSKELDPANNNNQEFFKEEYDKVQEAYKALSNSSILATENGATLNTSTSNYDLKTPNDSVENKKKKNMFTYIFNRKRNILTFVVLVFILKLVLHFFLFPETEKAVNYDKKIYIRLFDINQRVRDGLKAKRAGTTYNPDTTMWTSYIVEPAVCDGCGARFFYYPKEIHTQSFKVHLQKIFSNKPYIFLIAICILLFLVILFNDKIKAR